MLACDVATARLAVGGAASELSKASVAPDGRSEGQPLPQAAAAGAATAAAREEGDGWAYGSDLLSIVAGGVAVGEQQIRASSLQRLLTAEDGFLFSGQAEARAVAAAAVAGMGASFAALLLLLLLLLLLPLCVLLLLLQAVQLLLQRFTSLGVNRGDVVRMLLLSDWDVSLCLFFLPATHEFPSVVQLSLYISLDRVSPSGCVSPLASPSIILRSCSAALVICP